MGLFFYTTKLMYTQKLVDSSVSIL